MKWLLGVLLGIAMTVNAYARDYEADCNVVYAAPDGKTLKATVYMPNGPVSDDSPRRPGLVMIHGGAWLGGNRYQQGWYCKHFARQGYVVMTIEYRMLPQYAFPHCLHDCKAAVRWLRTHADDYHLDPERIGAFGASAGGHLASFLAATTPSDGFEGTENLGPSSAVSCAISLYGAVDLTKYRDMPRRPVSRRVSKRFIGAFARDLESEDGDKGARDTFLAASPVAYAKPSTRPILFVHGTWDILVSYRQSESFHQRLRELGVPTRLILAAKRGHGFDYIHIEQRRRIFDEMLAFLDEHV